MFNSSPNISGINWKRNEGRFNLSPEQINELIQQISLSNNNDLKKKHNMAKARQ